MKAISEIRRQNLIAIMDKDYEGKQVLLARAIGVLPNLVSRWISGKGIGSNAARDIEEKTRRQKYWLDTDHDASDEVVPNGATLPHEIGIIAARNLDGWMRASKTLNTQARVAEKAGVGAATVKRCLDGDGGISLKNLNHIVQAFGRQTYEVLVPPDDRGSIAYDHAAYARLPEEDKAKIRSFIEFVLQQNNKQK